MDSLADEYTAARDRSEVRFGFNHDFPLWLYEIVSKRHIDQTSWSATIGIDYEDTPPDLAVLMIVYYPEDDEYHIEFYDGAVSESFTISPKPIREEFFLWFGMSWGAFLEKQRLYRIATGRE